jgi:hypothetical protein
MKVHKSITALRVAQAVQRQMSALANPGFCVACGKSADGVEPDARRYKCESCGEATVYGAEELMMEVAL